LSAAATHRVLVSLTQLLVAVTLHPSQRPSSIERRSHPQISSVERRIHPQVPFFGFPSHGFSSPSPFTPPNGLPPLSATATHRFPPLSAAATHRFPFLVFPHTASSRHRRPPPQIFFCLRVVWVVNLRLCLYCVIYVYIVVMGSH